MRQFLCRHPFAFPLNVFRFPTARIQMTTRAGASLRPDDVREISEMRTHSPDLQERWDPRISNRQSSQHRLSAPTLAVVSSPKIYSIRLRYIGEMVQKI